MARPGFSQGVKSGGGGQVLSLILTIVGLEALAAFAAGSLKLRMPATGKIIGMTANVESVGGTHVTSTLDVSNGATSLLAAPFDVAAMTPGTPVDKEGSALAAGAASVAKDAELRATLATSGGTNPTVRGLTLQIDYVPLGD